MRSALTADPIQLVWMVNQIGGYSRVIAFNLLHHPDELDGVALSLAAEQAVAINLLHHPDEPHHSEIRLALDLQLSGRFVLGAALVVVDNHQVVDHVLTTKEALREAAGVDRLLAFPPLRPG